MPTAQTETTALDLTWVRSQFPSLSQTVNGQPAVFLDGPGGTQVPQRVIDAITDYLTNSNANTCGAYATSRRTDAVIAEARAAMADFLGCDQDEIVFGPNMTTLTFAISRSIGRELGPGDEILLTHLDHDANVSPWQALEERGVTIRFAEINHDDCTLDLADLAQKISSRTRVVAVGYASNAVGTINDVKEISAWPTKKEPWPTSTPSTTRPTGRLMSAPWIAISWRARLTSSSDRTWAFSTASANTCSACSPTKSAPTQMPFPIAGSGAR